MANITQETAQKIDFLIQGVTDGKFDEVAQKIEFMKKLSGDHEAPNYLQNLLIRINDLEQEKDNLRIKVENLEAQVNEFEGFKSQTQYEMKQIARALQYLFKPDPIGASSELHDAETFIQNKGARRY